MPNEPWPALVDLTFSEAAELIAQWGVHAAVSDRELSDRELTAVPSLRYKRELTADLFIHS